MSSYDSGGAALAGLLVIYLIIFIFAIGAYVVQAWFLMKIFQKAGVEGAWRAWVPVYNSMIFLKLGDVSPWLALYGVGAATLLGWIPGLNFLVIAAVAVPMALAAYRIGLKLGKEPAWVVLYILVTLVWEGILAFDQSRWNTQIAPAGWAGNSFLADNTVWEGVPVQTPTGYAPGYGQPQAPQYGAPGYGQPQAPQYGAPGYGQPQASQYGAPQAPEYGQPQYGAPQAPEYGQPQYGAPQYGQPQPPQVPGSGQPQAPQVPDDGQPQAPQSPAAPHDVAASEVPDAPQAQSPVEPASGEQPPAVDFGGEQPPSAPKQ